MARYAHALIAVWDGKSRGARLMMETIKKAGRPVYICAHEMRDFWPAEMEQLSGFFGQAQA
jgi:hypothetical protein